MQKQKKKHNYNREELVQKVSGILFSDMELPEATKALLRKWLITGEDDKEADAALRRHFELQYGAEHDTGLIEDLRKRFTAATGVEFGAGTDNDPRPDSGGNRLWRRTLFRVAAVLIPLLVIGAAVRLILRPVSDNTETVIAETVALPVADSVRTIIFPDGSTARVKPGSFISYPGDFNNNREVALSGEAFFSVKHREGKPFRVISKSVTVTVHGTEFSVKEYDYDEEAEVKLTSGSIAVTANGAEETVMTPGNRLVYDKKHQTVSINMIDEGEMLRLRGINLSLEDVSLDEALRLIGGYYQIKMKVAANVPDIDGIIVRLDDDATIEQALLLLRATNPVFDYRIEDDMVTITKR